MAAPTPTDPRDLDATPAFLRQRGGSHSGASGETAGSRRGSPKGSSKSAVTGERARAGPADPERADRLDPASLPLPSLSRRRLATVAGIVVVAWVVLAFGRQVGEASAASGRADELRAGNAALRQDVATLQQDLARVQDGSFIGQQGRQFGLGGRGEVPFTLAADAPPLAADAPGSAAVRLGAIHDRRSTFEVWLATLFGG